MVSISGTWYHQNNKQIKVSIFPKSYPFKLIVASLLNSPLSFIFPASLLVAREAAQQNSVGEMKEKEEEEEEDLSLAYAARGQGSTL